jgi:hypothetical protein
LTEICLDERGSSAVSIDFINQQLPLVMPPAGNDNMSAKFGQMLCGRSANPTVASGDERHLSGKFQIAFHFQCLLQLFVLQSHATKEGMFGSSRVVSALENHLKRMETRQ